MDGGRPVSLMITKATHVAMSQGQKKNTNRLRFLKKQDLSGTLIFQRKFKRLFCERKHEEIGPRKKPLDPETLMN